MKIKKLEIEGIGGIKELTIDFNEQMNLICGPNGVGKTTILECIGHAFANSRSTILRRNVAYASGKFSLVIDNDQGQEQTRNFATESFHPSESNARFSGFHEIAKKVIVFKTHRTFDYINLENISKDTAKNANTFAVEAFNGVGLQDTKNWLVQRFMWSGHDGLLSEEQMSNLKLAQKVFGLLSDEIEFAKIKPDTFDILVKNNSGEIYYEYLSSGYKSCLQVLLGLIKEIELRFKEPYVKAEEFDGLVLLDEVDLHLHPEWQAKLLHVLKDVFPRVQFIATTHSPHMIQAASPQEIIALGFNDGSVEIRELPSEEFGFRGWTVDEILTDVMGMKSTKSDYFQELLQDFFQKIDAEDEQGAKDLFLSLEKILHPNNELRKLMKLHLADLGIEV
jgi:predicted ATP-dependent endonuclease of OLD family